MQRILKISLVAVLVLAIASCGSSSKEKNASLTDKKAALQKLKDQQKKLEDDIAKIDTSAAKAEKAKLVVLSAIAPENFTHYIDLQGKIESQNISYIAPRNGTGGVVRAVYVKRGDKVRKGQLLLKLDNVLQSQNVANGEQALLTQKTQAAFLQNLYQKQKKPVGSEYWNRSTVNYCKK